MTMEPIITVSTVLAMFMSMVNQTDNNKYCYNADMENSKVNNIEVYDNLKSGLKAKVKYTYAYDSNDRLTEKQTLAYNNMTKTWMNMSRLTYIYNDNGMTIEKCLWNAEKNEYSRPVEMAQYEFANGNVMAVNHYKWNNETAQYRNTGSMLIMNPDVNSLMAEL